VQRLYSIHGHFLVQWITGQSGESAKFQQEGTNASGACDTGLTFRYSILEINRAVWHPRGRIKRGDQPLGHVLGKA